MRCEKAGPLLVRLLDGELNHWTAGRVRRHLARCPDCRTAHQEIEALGTGARSWRNVTAPPALKDRIGAALAASPPLEEVDRTATAVPGRPAFRGKELLKMPAVRWTTIGIAAAGLALLWSADQRGDVVLAAAIRAAEAVRAVHMVGEGSRGTHAEAWWVDGVGALTRIEHGRDEQLDVDNMKERYFYTVRERPAGAKLGQSQGGQPSGALALERHVDVGQSAMADPKQRELAREQLTFADILKQLQRRYPPQAIQSGWAVVNGQRLRRITAKGDAQVFYVDPATDRLEVWEDWGGYVGPRDEYVRMRIDYPDPASVDPRLFQFQVPSGVPVHRIRPGAYPRPQPPRPRNRQERVWLKQQQLVDGCLAHMSQIREALRRYANDHHGEWPPSLIPALDPYVKGRDVFRCPADHGSGETSYIYHRLIGAQAAAALKAMNENSPPANTPSRMDTPVLLECPHHPPHVWQIDARGNTFTRSQSQAAR